MAEIRLRHRLQEWPEERVVFAEPVGGIRPGQPDCLVWVVGRWQQMELKYRPGGSCPAGWSPYTILRAAQRKRKILSVKAGIPYFVAVLTDPVVLIRGGRKYVQTAPELDNSGIKGKAVQEVELWEAIANGPAFARKNFIRLGCIELRDFNPDTIALLINSVPRSEKGLIKPRHDR